MNTLSMRDQAMRISVAARQAAVLPSGCKTCQRQGLAIFPLRIAAITRRTAPLWQSDVPTQTSQLSGGEYKYALRTLREGYLYVLLDEIVWQAYQVTAEGHMRAFCYQNRPEGERVELLSRACREINHDITASFINIDPEWNHAEIAFSSDPWSKEVLAAYLKKRPEGRFTHIDLKAFRQSPQSQKRGMALDYSLSSLTENVTEFRTGFFPQPGFGVGTCEHVARGGMHGFYPRIDQDKMHAMRSKVGQIIAKYGTAGAVILDDAVGVIQELNYGRLQLIEDCHAWTSRTDIRHQHMTSQAISHTFKIVQEAINNNSQPEYGRPDSGYPVAMQQTTTAADVATRNTAFEFARLNACYNESARLEFETKYKSCVGGWQEKISAIDRDLAACYSGRAWQIAMNHDYAPQKNNRDWLLHMKTLSVCLQGGPLEHSDIVWLEWMKKPDSPAYVGLLGLNHTQNAAIFDGIAGINELQTAKAMQELAPDTAAILDGAAGYSYLKTAGASDEFASFLKLDDVQLLVTGRIAALSAAYSRLQSKLDIATRNGYSRILQGSAYSITGETVHLLEIETTLKRFQRLVNLHPNSWSTLSVARNSAAFGGDFMPGETGFAAATGGLINITDEKLLNLPLTIRITTTDLQASAALEALPDNTSLPEKISAMHGLRVSSVSLKGNLNAPIAVPPETLLTERNRRFLSGNSVGLVLSAVMLGLQISDWQHNSDNLAQTVGNHTDASMTLAINRLMVLSAASEIGGFSHMLMTRMSWQALDDSGFVHPLIKAGGVIAGAAAVIDGIRMFIQSFSSYKSGDTLSSGLYLFGSISTIAGGTLGVISSWNGVFALTGMAGLGALLILVGAGIAYAAEQYRSTPLEVWLRCSCFGKNRHDSDMVWHANVKEDLPRMLEAWYAVISGTVAEIAFSAPMIIYGEYYREVKIKLVLPGYKDGISALQYTLASGDMELASVSLNVAQQPDTTRIHPRCTNPQSTRIVTDEAVIMLICISIRESQCPSAALSAHFWPDVTNAQYRESLTVMAEW